MYCKGLFITCLTVTQLWKDLYNYGFKVLSLLIYWVINHALIIYMKN